MTAKRKVSVWDNGVIVARVEYSENLDRWDGRNYTCGSTGRHKGITRLKNGEYVLIHGTQWQGERDNGEVIDADRALQEIMESENVELLEEKRFAELKKLYSEKYDNEMIEEEK